MKTHPMKWLQHNSRCVHHQVHMVCSLYQKSQRPSKNGSVWILMSPDKPWVSQVSHRFTSNHENYKFRIIYYTYRLIILWLCWCRGSRSGDGYRSCSCRLRHHGGLDWGELVLGQSMSCGGLLRVCSTNMCRSCWGSRLLPQSTTETLTKLLYGNLQGPHDKSNWTDLCSPVKWCNLDINNH